MSDQSRLVVGPIIGNVRFWPIAGIQPSDVVGLPVGNFFLCGASKSADYQFCGFTLFNYGSDRRKNSICLHWRWEPRRNPGRHVACAVSCGRATGFCGWCIRWRDQCELLRQRPDRRRRGEIGADLDGTASLGHIPIHFSKRNWSIQKSRKSRRSKQAASHHRDAPAVRTPRGNANPSTYYGNHLAGIGRTPFERCGS